MLSIRGLAAGYGDGATVLDALDFDVAAGERVAVMGRNRMGKTSFLRTIMGHLQRQAGALRFDGRDISTLPTFAISNLGIAYVPQGREIFGELTVEDNLRLGMLGKSFGSSRVPPSTYERFPILGQRRQQRAGTLSGGEQQQLAVARALLGRPRLLLLDEPGEGIQPSLVQSMARTVLDIAVESGIAVLLVEQSLDLVRTLTQRCVFMENGRMVEEAPSGCLRPDSDVVLRHLSV